MNSAEIREIVKITLDELMKRKLVKIEDYKAILKRVEPKIEGFFGGKKSDETIAMAIILNALSDDFYIDIIYLSYRDHKTLEWIAEYYDVEISTIKRNKKRLIYKINELLEG